MTALFTGVVWISARAHLCLSLREPWTHQQGNNVFTMTASIDTKSVFIRTEVMFIVCLFYNDNMSESS